MLLGSRYHHRAARVGGHVKLLDAQRINGKRVAMRRISFVRAGAVIGVVAEIGTALHGTRRQNRAVLGAGSLGQLVDSRRQVVDDPVPPSRGIAVLIGIEYRYTK